MPHTQHVQSFIVSTFKGKGDISLKMPEAEYFVLLKNIKTGTNPYT